MTKVSLISVLFLMEGGSNALVHPSRQIMTTGPSHQHCNFESSGPWRQKSCLSLAASSSDSEQKPPRKVKIRARAAVKGSSSSSSSTATISRTKKTTKTKTKTKKSKPVTKKAFKAGEMSKAKAIIDEPPAVEAMETEKEPPPKYWSQKPTIHTKSGAPWQHQEMMDHDILTKEEELMYGRRVVRAHELREKVDELLEEKRVEMEMRRLEMEEMQMNNNDGGSGGSNVGNELDYDFLSYELEYLSVYGFRPNKDMQGEMQQENSNSNSNNNNNNNNNLGGMDLNDDLLFEHSRHRSQHMSQLRDETQNFVGSNVGGPKRNGYRNSSTSTANRNSYTPLLHIPMHRLSESDVVRSLSVPGGKSELTDIMLDGAYARETLMRRNVKLVMSIAKNWMRNSFSTANANLSGGGSFESSGKDKSRSSRKFLSQMYEGSWDRPSLDEAMQEGMLGLARAVDKYDPERGLRFSTYATHWITSYVRVCFQRAVTGCLHVPSQLHDIKVAYNKIVKDHLHTGSDPPEQRSIAAQLGISEQRLTTAIRATGSLVSVDAPIVSSGGSAYKGSMAGGDGAGGNELLILDTLKCAEPKPEDQVEISFLRQCLENAMATELTPYERDVLRLRLGLDSGEGKTVREICKLAGGSVSMSDVRSAERRAFKKLRSPTSVHTHNLLAYLDLAGGEFGRSGVGGVGNSARR